MRRFGWQIGGLSVALLVVLGLGMLAFGCGSPQAPAHVRASATVAPRATATADPRVAQVQDAARHYVEALNNAMKTGSPDELDSLSVPGSQAEGDAGASAHVVHNDGKAFVVTSVIYQTVDVDASSTVATATLDYSIVGYDASWPSLSATSSSRTIARHVVFDLSLVNGSWLVDTVR